MAGYTRQDTSDNIADTKTINAADLDAEFDAVEAAFNNSTGHSHDGTAAEGAPIEVTGPNQEYLSEAAQFRPNTDDTYDLGSATFQWKDLYVDGTANIDSLVADTADIDGGTIDNAVIGGTTPAAGSFTTVSATGNIIVGGTVDGRDVAADGTKLDGIEAGADVTDTANVTAAGALMDSELTNIAAVKALDQGVATTDSPAFSKVSTGDGTAAAPAIIFTNDTDTGLYRRTTDELNISTGGSEHLRVSAEPRAKTSGNSTTSTINVWASFTSLDTESFIAQSTGILITGDVTFYGAGGPMYVYSRLRLIVSNSINLVGIGNTQVDGLGTSFPFDYVSQSPSVAVTGLTPGVSYTAILDIAKGSAAACTAQGLVNYVHG